MAQIKVIDTAYLEQFENTSSHVGNHLKELLEAFSIRRLAMRSAERES